VSLTPYSTQQQLASALPSQESVRIQSLLFGATICIAAAAAVACSDNSQGPNIKNVSVDVSVLGTPAFTVGQSTDGYPLANCNISLMARVTGGNSMAWSTATFYWYAGLDRTKALDSAVAPAADVQSSWDNAAIDSVGLGQGGWIVSYGLPFDLDIVFHYTTGSSSELHSIRTPRMTCGPAVPQGSVAPPAITQLTFVQSRAQWQPSDSMWIQFQASSQNGLWLTYADFSGAFTTDSVYNDALQVSAQHVVHTRIPANSALGAREISTIFAVDEWGQTVQQTIQTSALVDITPPGVNLYMFPPISGSLTPNIGGTYFVGDTIAFVPFLTDNHAVGAFEWRAQPGNYADSMPPSALGAQSRLNIPVHGEWGDSVQFRFWAMDSSGNVSDTVRTPAHAFKVYQTLNRPTVSASLNGNVTAAMIDTVRSLVYVMQGNQHSVAVFSLLTLQQTTTIPLPGYPQSFDMTPGGDSLIVSLYRGQLAVIDLRSLSTAPTIISLSNVDTLSGQASGAMRIAANDRAFVARGGPTAADGALIEVNLATGAQRIRADAGVPSALARSLDQRVLIVAVGGCVERYDIATDSFGACTVMSQNPALPSVDRAGQHFAIGFTAFDASFAPIRTVQSPWDSLSGALPSAISADGAYLYYYYGPTGLVRARVSDGAVMERARVPQFFSTGFLMNLSPDGTTMLLGWDDGTQGGTSHLATVDLRDADAQPLLVARAPSPLPLAPLRTTRIAPPSAPRAARTRPWLASPPAPRPWRSGAATRAPRDHDRS